MKKINIFLIIFLFLAFSCVYAIDIENLGDFASRSLIIQKSNPQNKIDFELKEKLRSKKLVPCAQCLIEQVNKNNIENIKLLIKTDMDLNQSYFGDFAIYRAARNNHFETVKLLYENGAKLDRGYYSELYEAIRNKNKEMAKFLIDNNAKINYQDLVTNNTNLSMALKNNMLEIAQELIKKGANMDFKSYNIIKKKKINLENIN